MGEHAGHEVADGRIERADHDTSLDAGLAAGQDTAGATDADESVDDTLDEIDPLDDADDLHATPLTEDIDDLDDLDDDDDDEDDDLDDEDDDDLDDDDEDDDDLDDDDFDDLEDATDEDIDLVLALYHEDGEPVAMPLPQALANDLEALIAQLRRLPADAGAAGMVSIAGEFFVIVRVRGPKVQLVLSDVVSSNDWPIARDVVDTLGVEVPDPDDDSEPVGDLGLFADQGLSDFDLETYASDLDEDSDQLLASIAKRINFGEQFRRAVASGR